VVRFTVDTAGGNVELDMAYDATRRVYVLTAPRDIPELRRDV
jgi:hypothetical protein